MSQNHWPPVGSSGRVTQAVIQYVPGARNTLRPLKFRLPFGVFGPPVEMPAVLLKPELVDWNWRLIDTFWVGSPCSWP